MSSCVIIAKEELSNYPPKLIVENTIEQNILEMQKSKKSLQDGIYDNDKQQDDMKFGSKELLELLR